ncbi:MAG: PIG-L family deacetylase [Chitinophagales bacterium]
MIGKSALPAFLAIFFHLSLKASGPNVLVVIAHPDDETGFAASIYKITHDLHGTADIAVITNGEGGYKYATLAEPYYGLELTNEAIGREHLPGIRKQELMNAGKIIGIRNIFFLDQKDAHYSQNEHEPLDTSWNVAAVSARLNEILTTRNYDFVFCLLPTLETHGGHKAASLLALRAVAGVKETIRPVILGAGVSSVSDSVRHFHQLKNYTESETTADTAVFHFNRNAKFGYRKTLSYQIIVNWEIAEHKSQGTMQLAMNQGVSEDFWFFKINNNEGFEKARQLFSEMERTNLK